MAVKLDEARVRLLKIIDTGNLELPIGADVYSNASLFFGTKTRIGTGTNNTFGIYSTGKIMLRPNNGTLGYADGFELSTTTLIPTKNNTVTLGDSTHYWKHIYATQVTSTTASGTSFAFTEVRTNGPSVSFGVGSGNVNHGVYSNTLGKWIAYADATNIYLNGNALTATALTSNAGSSSLPIYFTGGKPAAVSNIEIKATDTTSKSIKVTNSNGSVGIYTSTNQGLYDFIKFSWIIYRPTGTSSTYIPAWANIGSAYVPTYHGANGVPTAVTANSVITNLASTSGASIFAASPRPGVTGTLPITNGGTGNTAVTANRLAWTESASKITAGYHYASSTKVAIASTAEPTETFLVNGASRLDSTTIIAHKLPAITAPAVGWYRVAEIAGRLNYLNCLVLITGSYSSTNPSHVLLHISGMHNSPTIKQIGGYKGHITSARITGEKGSYYLEIYLGTTTTGQWSETTFQFIGNVKLKTTYTPTTPNGAESTYTSTASIRTMKDTITFAVADNSATNTGTAVTYDSSANITLKLPATIKASLTGNASTATKLAAGKTFKVNLASTSASSAFDGSQNITDIGVSGTLAATNGGTGNNAALTANRFVWSESTTKMTTTGTHYINSTKIAVNSTSAPTENFYVNGSVRFGLGSNDGVSNKRFIIGTAGNRYLSLGGAGIQAYNTSDAGGTLYLQYQGGSISIGQSTSVTAPITIYGAINPGATNTYTLGTSSYNWSTVNARALTSAAALAINSANTTTVSSASTIYLTTSGSSSILFSTNATTRGRWSPTGKLIIGTKSESDYNLDVTGTSYFSNTALFDTPPVIRHSGSRWGYIYFQNDAGLHMGTIGHDVGNATTVQTSRFFFRQYSANTTNDTGNTGHYESYYLPESTDGLTNSDTVYNILTTKNTVTVGQGGTGKTSFTTNYILLGNGTSGIKTENAHFNYTAGTTSANGYEEFVLGNSTAAGTAGNRFGRLALYSAKAAGIYLVAADATSWTATNTLPNTSGIILNTGTTTWTAMDAATAKVGTLKLNSSNNILYDVLLYARGVNISGASITDINTIKVPSVYYSNNSTETAGLTNSPQTSSGYRLMTFSGYQGVSSYGWQLAAANQQICWRLLGSSNASPSDWYSWIKFIYGTAVGSATKPFYLTSSGVPTECSTYAGGTAVTLNGTSKAASTASFYAPTGAGTSGYILKSNGSGAPSWLQILPVANGGTGLSTLTSGYALIGNGTSAVSLRAITNNTSKGALGWSSSVGTNLITSNTLAYWNGAYTGTTSNLSVLGTITTGVWNATKISLTYGGTNNNLSGATKGSIIYVAADGSGLWYSTVGSTGQVLTSGGSGAPTWTTATNSNTASTIVKRDSSGNFSAGTITAALSGNATTATTLATARTLTIGKTGKTFNGGANVAWSLPEIGAWALDGSTSGLFLTGGDGNTAGYRLIGQASIVAWGNYRLSFIVSSRHTGNGLVTISYGCNKATVSAADCYCNIRYFGISKGDKNGAIESDSFCAYVSSDGATMYFFWKYRDYNTTYISVLNNNNAFVPSSGTWMTSIGSTYGTAIATMCINMADSIFDAGNNSTITLNYSAAGLSSTSWLAAWNGYELRAIAPANITAGRATADASGNTITSTYLKLSGGTMTGKLAISYAHAAGGMFQLMSTSSNEASIDYAAGGTTYWVVGKGCGGTGNGTFAWWYNPNVANVMSLTKDGVLTVSQLVGTAKYLARNGDTSIPMVFNWSGQSGQPSWLWGGNDGTNMYVYNPSNFSVNYANSAGYTTRWDVTASNPTTIDTDNSTGYFDKAGSHVYWYHTTPGLVNNQPSVYGYILDIGNYSERHQIWMIQPHGDMCHRGGNGAGWGGAWKTILDSSNYTSYALPLSGGTVSGVITINNGNSSGYLQLYEDGEGGTIKMVGPNATYAWEVDAYNDSTFRIFTNGSGSYKFFTFDGSSGAFSATSVYGAVWNDYAEYRAAETIEPGRVVQESNDGIMKLTVARLQAGCEIISDTFGFAIGKTENCQAPIAVAGRVLAYPYENRNSFELGQAVCSGPNGTVSKMTREEVMMYPERIIGTVSEIPEYETWGTGNINVDGRIWIRIK